MGNVTEIDGHIPNYVDPPTRVPEFLGVQISFTIVALVVVGLRLYTRKSIRNILTAEDYVAAVSMILCLVSGLVSCIGVLGGDGLHYYDIPPSYNRNLASSTSFVTQVLYQPILQLARISILLFYMTNLGKGVRTICIGLGIASILFGIACTVVEFVQCSPAYMLWSAEKPAEYTCINQILFFRVSGIVNLALDVVLLLTPLPVVWELRIPMRSKVALSGIFSIGLVSIAAEIARIVIWFRTNDGNRESPDSAWNRVDLVDWSCIEYTAAVICASLPHLKALVSVIIPGYFDSTQRSTGNKSRHASYSMNKLQSSKTNGQGQTKNSTRHSHHPLPYDGGGTTYGNTVSIFGKGGTSSAHGYTNESEEHILDTMDSSGAWKKTDPGEHSMSAPDNAKEEI